MIGIKVNGEFLDLFPDTTISMILNNPIFADDDIIPGSIALPFDIPGGELSEKNARILNHPDNVETFGITLRFPNSTIFFDGQPFKTGELRINPVSGKLYRGNFRIGLKTIASDFKNKSIRELLDEEIEVTDWTYHKKIFIAPKEGAPTPYSITINGNSYEGETLTDLVNDINSETESPRGVATLKPTGSTPLGHPAPYVEIVPDVNDTDFASEFSVSLSDNTHDNAIYWHAEAASLDNYHNHVNTFFAPYLTSAPPDDRFRLPVFFDEVLYGEFNIWLYRDKSKPIMNRSEGGDLYFNDVNYGVSSLVSFRVRNHNSISPCVMLKHVLKKIEESFEVKFTGEFMEDPILETALFVSPNTLDIRVPYLGDDPFIFFAATMNLKDFLPDWTIEQLLKNLQKRLNISIRYNDELAEIVLNRRQNIVNEKEYTDITSISAPLTDIDYVAYEGVRLYTSKDEDDQGQTDDYVNIGAAEHSITTAIMGLEQERTFTTNEGNYSGPLLQMPSGSDFLGKLIFYDGLTTSAPIYPAATIDGWKMKFSGTGNGYDSYWTEYARFLMTRKKVTTNIRFELRHLLELDWEKKYRIDRVNYFFKTINVKLTMKGIEESKCELYTV